MAKHLTKDNVEAIIDVIEGWQDRKVTWDEICDEVSNLIGKRPTRQSLNSNEQIKAAYKARKKGLKLQGPRVTTPSSLKTAAIRITKMQSEIDTLKKFNSALLEKFVKWQYNSHAHGLKKDDLNKALPVIDRERTDQKKI